LACECDHFEPIGYVHIFRQHATLAE